METTKIKRTRDEVRAAFRETMRKKKERMEENLKRMDFHRSQQRCSLRFFISPTSDGLRTR